MYFLIRSALSLLIHQFFSRIRIKGEPQVDEGALIIAATHPNQAMDPFLVATIYDRETYFLAKSTLFRNPILGALFKALHMIPVYRATDKSDTAKNKATFQAAANILKSKKAIAIFPEGTSREERQILSLKTGAARIAFQAEEESLFLLGVKIQPVGITYGEPRKFQSSVTINFGSPIELKDYIEEYKRDPRSTVQKITDVLEEKLRDLSIDLKDIANQPLVEKIATIFRSGNLDDQELFKRISEKVETVGPLYPEEKIKILEEIDNYLKLTEQYYADEYHPYSSLTAQQKFFRLLISPVVFSGALFHAVPYYLVRLLITALRIEPYNFASVKIGLSLLLFPLWYLILFLLAISGGISGLHAIIFLGVVMALGHLTNRYIAETWLSFIAYAWPGSFDPIQELDEVRARLQEKLRKY